MPGLDRLWRFLGCAADRFERLVMSAEHAFDRPGDGELLHADDEVFAGRSEWRVWNDLLLVVSHNGLAFAVTIPLSDLRDFGAL